MLLKKLRFAHLKWLGINVLITGPSAISEDVISDHSGRSHWQTQLKEAEARSVVASLGKAVSSFQDSKLELVIVALKVLPSSYNYEVFTTWTFEVSLRCYDSPSIKVRKRFHQPPQLKDLPEQRHMGF